MNMQWIQYRTKYHRVKMRAAALFYCGIFVVIFGSNVRSQDGGVLDKIKTGLQYASNYLETAREIADLVSESLGPKSKKRGDDFADKENNFGTGGLVSAFFRLLGLDRQKISAIVVNSAIFLAQMISSSFNLNPLIEQGRSFDEDTMPIEPMQLILNSQNERIQKLVMQAQDPDLPDQLIDRTDGPDTSCIRHLLCKTTPFISAAQLSLANNNNRSSKNSITSWLPSKDEFERNAYRCEESHVACELFPN